MSGSPYGACQIVDVREVARAISLAVEEPGIEGIFNIAECSYTIPDIAYEILISLDVLSKRTPEMEVRGEADLRSYKVDTLKARWLLRFMVNHSHFDMVKPIVEKVDSGEISEFDTTNTTM